MFRFLVLGLLRKGEARHGYAMMKEYRERAGVQVSTGNFYRELQRLVTAGLVRTASKSPGTDARRAPYEITEAGAAAFDAWLAEPAGSGVGGNDDALSARAVFLAEAGPTAAWQALERWQEELWMRGRMLERARESALRRESGNGAAVAFEVLHLLLARRLKHVAADLEFLDEFRNAYQHWSGVPDRLTRPSSPVRAVPRRVPADVEAPPAGDVPES